MLVRNCVAHDGKRAPIQLVDELGCVTRPKIMSKFQKIKNFGSSASVVSYAYFQAFKFPDSMNVHFQCVIQVCRYNCPDPVCGTGEAVLDASGLLGSFSSGPAPPKTLNNLNTVFNNPNQRLFKVDPRKNGPRPAGLVISEEQLDQYTAPAPAPTVPGTVDLPGTRRAGLQPPRSPPKQPQRSLFPKIPGLSKKLGDFLSGRSMQSDGQKRLFKRELADDQILSDHERSEMFGKPVLRRLYKRDAQEMADIEMDGVIQVLSPGDVAFTLGQGGNDTTVISSTADWDPNNICMSLSSLVGGLVMLIGKSDYETLFPRIFRQ